MTSAYPIIINKSNHIGGSTFQYRFGRNVDFNNMDIALGSASLFYSWRNITAAKNNHQFQIIHPTSTTDEVLTITIADGGYEIADINNYLRWYLITNGYYIYNNTTGEQTVYCELRVNASTYSVEFVSYPMPTSLPTGYTAGSAITFPATTLAPQLTVLDNNFGTLIGYEAGDFPATQQIVLTTTSSTQTPQLSDVINVLLNLDVVSNPFSPSSFVIHSISPANTQYGRLITDNPNELSFVPCQPCGRDSITLSFTNQNGLALDMIDYDITIKLLLRYHTN